MSELWRSEYPFASHRLALDGIQMHYVDEGPGDGGASPILFVHGNPTWSFAWRHLIAKFRERRRVVAVDHIGCGLSDKPQDYPYTLRQHVDNLRRLIDRLNLRDLTLVAHDWGGAIGLGAAVAEPQRFSGLVLCNTAGFRAPRCPWRIRICRTPVVGPLGVRGGNLFVRAALKMATSKPERFTAAVKAGYLAPYDSWANRVAVQRFVEDIPLSPRHPSYDTLLGIERGLESLRHLPVLLAWGMRDWCFTPYFLERFREFFPAATVRRYDDAGHFVMEDARERLIADVAEFIDRQAVVTSEAPS